MDLFADEGRTTGENIAIIRRPKPTLITIGQGRSERQLCSTGRFNNALGADFLISNRGRWVPVGELARFFYAANTPRNKERVRRRMSELWNHLLVNNRMILLYEFSDRRISAVKIFDPTSEQDSQAASTRIERMAKRYQWTQQQYELVQSVLRADIALRETQNLPIGS